MTAPSTTPEQPADVVTTASRPATTAPSTATTTAPRQVASMHERRARQQRALTATVAISLFIHLFAFAAWAFFPSTPKRVIDLDQASVKARLVKLGKPRDEKLLPRIPTAPAPTPVDKKAPPTLETPKTPDKESIEPDKKSAADILNQFKNENDKPKSINDIIKDRIGEDDNEGQEFGDKDGTALDGEVTDSYFARVTARIQKSMEVSSVLTDEERVRLKAVLCLKIDDAGAISDVQVKTSGSSVFDADVRSAASRASPVPAPPPPARARSAEGVCFNFCPVRCN